MSRVKEIEGRILECAEVQENPTKKYASMSYDELYMVPDEVIQEVVDFANGSDGLFPGFFNRGFRIPLKDIIDLIRVYVVGLHLRGSEPVASLFSAIADPSLRVRDSSELDESENSSLDDIVAGAHILVGYSSDDDTLLGAWIFFMQAYVAGLRAEDELNRLGLKDAVDRFVLANTNDLVLCGYGVRNAELLKCMSSLKKDVENSLSGVNTHFLWPSR